jgi:hypothetical protein
MNGDILDPGVLLSAAKEATGLSNFGDDSLRHRLELAVAILRNQGMDEADQRAAADTCHWLLTTRLQLIEDRRRYPIAEEVIKKPIFVLGQARSGTTLLHALLSVDPNARALRFWEVMYPSPPPGMASADDPRKARADADWREINAKLPGWLPIHPYNDMLGDGLPECERTWAMDFRVMTTTAWWRVPMPMVVAGLPSDATAQYRLHKMMLQQFQYGRPKKYWVLKGFHTVRLKEMFEAYPDARCIWVHRDPVQAIASKIVMSGQLNEMLSGRCDWRALAETTLKDSRATYTALLAHPFVDDERIVHVPYADFMKDQVGTIRRFYESFSVPFTPETEKAMRGYLRENRGDRHGKFDYSTDVIGENIGKLHEEFAPYRKRFGLEIERRKSD